MPTGELHPQTFTIKRRFGKATHRIGPTEQAVRTTWWFSAAGRAGRRHDRGGGRPPRRDDGAAADRGHLRACS